ncbi:hypothetical protein JB92DRAFT_3114078 [Gautieria morchelliformis]|nr:hypothetical protein JB92DRAFT_3114078 [Gautieria morchelliformis]
MSSFVPSSTDSVEWLLDTVHRHTPAYLVGYNSYAFDNVCLAYHSPRWSWDRVFKSVALTRNGKSVNGFVINIPAASQREIPGIRIISPSDSTKSSDEGFLRSPEVGFERLSQAGSDKASLCMSNITDPNTAYLGTMNLAQAIRTNKVRGFSPSPSLQTIAPKNMPSSSVSPLKGFMQQIFTPNRKTDEDEPLPVYNGEIPRAHIHADKVTSLDMDPLSLTWLMSLTLKGVVFMRPLNLIAWCIYDDTDMKTVACMNVVELCRFMRAQRVKERRLNKGTVNTARYFEVCVAVVEMLASQRSEYMAAITKSLKTYRSFVVVGSDSYLCEGRDRQGKNMYGEALTLYQHRAWVLNTHDAKPANVNAIKALCF